MTTLWTMLTNVSNIIRIFLKAADWDCQPVLVLHFEDIGEYAKADAQISRAVAEQTLTPRQTTERTSSLEICGVKVRLDCPALYATPDGVKSGVEMLRDGSIQRKPLL